MESLLRWICYFCCYLRHLFVSSGFLFDGVHRTMHATATGSGRTSNFHRKPQSFKRSSGESGHQRHRFPCRWS